MDVTYDAGAPAGVRTVRGVYHHVTGTGWLHLRHSDGERAIRMDRITDVKEVY